MTTLNLRIDSWDKNDYTKLALSFPAAAIVTWSIHEFAHFFTGRALGYEMWISFNKAGLAEGAYSTVWHQAAVGMAGPIITWIQAMIALLFILRTRRLWLYSFLFLACWTRIIAMVISFISNPNDEASIGLLIGLPMWVLPAISVLFLLMLTVWGHRHLQAGWKSILIGYVMSSIVTTLVVFSDQWFFN